MNFRPTGYPQSCEFFIPINILILKIKNSIYRLTGAQVKTLPTGPELWKNHEELSNPQNFSFLPNHLPFFHIFIYLRETFAKTGPIHV